MKENHLETILAALADKITDQEKTIAVQKWQIEKLEKALAEAHAEADTQAVNKPAN